MLPYELRAFSPAEVADLFGVSRRTVERLLANGDLPFVPVGSRRRIPAWAVEDYLKGAA